MVYWQPSSPAKHYVVVYQDSCGSVNIGMSPKISVYTHTNLSPEIYLQPFAKSALRVQGATQNIIFPKLFAGCPLFSEKCATSVFNKKGANLDTVLMMHHMSQVKTST